MVSLVRCTYANERRGYLFSYAEREIRKERLVIAAPIDEVNRGANCSEQC